MVPLVFWTIAVLGPIPIWHLLLHAGLPFWKRSPRAFYGAALAVWAAFIPFALELSSASSSLFEPSLALKRVCLGASLAALGITVWSLVTLTPSRFFLWAALRPQDCPPVLIRRGPYRFTAHPTYLSMMATTAASFLASGQAVLLVACCSMALLLGMVVILEQRELRARLTSAEPESRIAHRASREEPIPHAIRDAR